jgi:hypothetical protein
MDTIDPIAVVERLSPSILRQRITELDRQRRALAILLRAAVARERAAMRATQAPVSNGGQQA